MKYETLKLLIASASESISDIRKLKRLLAEHDYLISHIREIPSTDSEMLSDWCDASALIGTKIIDEGINFEKLSSDCYDQLQLVWLHNIKKCKAHLIGEVSHIEDISHNYYEACTTIQNAFVQKPQLPEKDFISVKEYLEKYYVSNGKIDESKPINEIIRTKARRIWETTQNNDESENWLRAKEYTQIYYENIIPAVTKNDKEAIFNILSAFRISKAKENRFLIITSFEAIIAINFINKTALKEVIDARNISNII